jgi:hypothetical protein
MSTYIKYNCFAGDLAGGLHDILGTTPNSDCHCLKIGLSNTVGDKATSMTVFTAVSEIGAGTGYTAGGLPTGATTGLNSGTAASGTFTLTGTNQTWTATGGPMGPFQYVILYNYTSATKPLIACWDYASALTLQTGETFTVKFNNGASSGTIFTLA